MRPTLPTNREKGRRPQGQPWLQQRIPRFARRASLKKIAAQRRPRSEQQCSSASCFPQPLTGLQRATQREFRESRAACHRRIFASGNPRNERRTGERIPDCDAWPLCTFERGYVRCWCCVVRDFRIKGCFAESGSACSRLYGCDCASPNDNVMYSTGDVKQTSGMRASWRLHEH